MGKEALKQRALAEITARRAEIITIAETVLRHPEGGFQEVRTAALVQRVLGELGLPVRGGLALTGCRADIVGGDASGPTVALLGELDALPVPSHPFADAGSGMAHACGHHAQIAMLLGAAMALALPEVRAGLCGRVALLAVPSEEYQESVRALLEAGTIGVAGGKPELIRLGEFDDVDMAMMIHAGRASFVPESYNGFVVKRITFHGRAAHAGLAPEEGSNALSMARLALALLDAQRESLAEADHVRIHGIVTAGGEAVNVVPAEVTLEYQVRAARPPALLVASALLDRCVQGAALAFAGRAVVETLGGYLPYCGSAGLEEVHRASLALVAPEERLGHGGHRSSSTDMGDVSQIMPVLHAYTGGFAGTPHTADFLAVDAEKGYVQGAKLLALNVIELLYGDAACGRRIAAQPAAMSRAEYADLKQRSSGRESWDYRQP